MGDEWAPDAARAGRQSVESFYEEIDVVFKRHNELIAADPAMAAALMVNLADILADLWNVEFDVEQLDEGKWVVHCDEGTAGFLGFERDQRTDDIVPGDLPDNVEYVDEGGNDGE